MPLVNGSSHEAVSENIKRLMSENRPQRQAVAIALDVARRHRALGGFNPVNALPAPPRPVAAPSTHQGPIRAAVAGRTDHIPMKVRPNSYVLPADVVSALGEGNSEAGHQIVAGTFPPRPLGRDASGAAPDDEGIDIVAAGGENVLSPEQVNGAGNGDVKRGHNAIDKWVKLIRKQNIKTLQRLPGPVKE